MTLASLLAEVEAEACRDTLSSALDVLFERHQKQPGGCYCNYCQCKREATHYIGLAEYPPNYTGERTSSYGLFCHLEPREIKTLRRDLLRDWFRKQLKQRI